MTPSADALGVGLGLRSEFASQLANHREQVDFLEVIVETCFDPRKAEQALSLRDTFPMVCHGINMSLGSAELLDLAYLNQVGRVLASLEPAWFSEHLAVTRVGGIDIGQLAPVSFSGRQTNSDSAISSRANSSRNTFSIRCTPRSTSIAR